MLNSIKKFLKTRKAKVSKRGLYLQDMALKDSNFQPGQHFRYIVDTEKGSITIVPSDENTGNTVSKRILKNCVKPVLDIRSKKVLDCFKGCKILQVTLYRDHIIVQGFEEDTSEDSREGVYTKQPSTKSKITTISDFLKIKVKEKACIVLSASDLKKVSGLDCVPIQDYNTIDILTGERIPITSNISKKFIQEITRFPRYITSYFCGAGLMDKGFCDMGMTVDYALDKCPEALKTYSHNISNNINCSDILCEHEPPKTPIVLAGPCCQPYTSENRKTNIGDSLNDPPFLKLLDLIKKGKEVLVFVLENVPQFLTTAGGKRLDMIRELLPDFKVTAGILSSAAAGACQIRKRSIIIGSRIGKIELPNPILPLDKYVTVREAFEGITSDLANQQDYSLPNPITLERIKLIPPGGNVKSLPDDLRPNSQHSCSYLRLLWEKPAPSLPNVRKAVVINPQFHRVLSIREVARTLGVPDDFVFKGSLSSKYQQVANGVAVPLARLIAKTVREALEKYSYGFSPAYI